MKTYARPLLLVFAAIGLAASIASLYVHYRLYNDPTYVSFCDVNETVSCEQVLQSAYSTVGGIPVASFGAIWAAAVLLLAWRGMRTSSDAPVVAGYIFLLSTAGLAAVLYLAYASFFAIGRACPLCMAMYVAVIGTFIVSGAAASAPLGSLPGRIGRDTQSLLASSTGTTLLAVFAVAAIGLLVLFPRVEPVAASAGQTLSIPGAPAETLSADERAQFAQFLDAQPRVSLPVPADGAKVLVVKFNDYQCPACRATYLEYKWIQDKYRDNPDVKFVSVDFPLEAECGVGSIHPSACEAAVAVRLAKQRDRGEEMEQWLFLNQAQLTPDLVKQGVREVTGITDFDAQYQQVLPDVRADAKLGMDLNIESTPTFFINGIKLSSMRGIYFDAAIQHELSKAAAATP